MTITKFLKSIKSNWLAIVLIMGIIGAGITGFLKTKNFIIQTVNEGIQLKTIKYEPIVDAAKSVITKDAPNVQFSRLPVGVILAFGGDTIPEGWLPCDGRLIPDGPQYNRIREILGTKFCPNRSEYRVPNLCGRVPVGDGQGTDLSARILGQQFGKENYTLEMRHLPNERLSGTTSAPDPTMTKFEAAHGHTREGGHGNPNDCYVGENSGRSVVGNNYQTDATVVWSQECVATRLFKLLPHGEHQHQFNHTHTFQTNPMGNNDPHPSLPPSLVVKFIIKVTEN